ncbi:MAG TPA: hypothetical protein H9898_01160 [Candidatus Anaerobiospirillum stercoravium]|nr:hypothetical protein [Candidatus Anaerobiospirillum stercoravium]
MAQRKLEWHEQWLLALLGAEDYAQLRARSGVLADLVLRLDFDPGVITAWVGHDNVSYQVTLKLPSAETAALASFQAALSANEDWLATIREGCISKKIVACALAHGLKLFPRLDEVQVSCTCHDEAEAKAESEAESEAAVLLCPQVAAVIALVGEFMDDEPSLLLLLAGIDLEALLGHV